MQFSNYKLQIKSFPSTRSESSFSPICIFYSCLLEADGTLKFSMILAYAAKEMWAGQD
jgi:hypothetical protein